METGEGLRELGTAGTKGQCELRVRCVKACTTESRGKGKGSGLRLSEKAIDRFNREGFL